MKRLTFLALSALALSGCTRTHIKSAAVCDGKHRRPANLYGSIVPTLPVPLPASQGGGQSLVAPASGRASPTQAPDAATGNPPASAGAMDTVPSAPRTSRRDIALSYLNC